MYHKTTIMDNWKKELGQRFDKENWTGCINFLKEKINQSDDMDLYLNILYVYMYYLVEVKDNQAYWDIYQNELMLYYKRSSDIYANNDEYLFYICFIASMSEWFMDLTMKDIKQFMQTIYRRHPDNLLFKWGYSLFCMNDEKLSTQYCWAIINNIDVVNELSNRSLLGTYILNGIKYRTSGI